MKKQIIKGAIVGAIIALILVAGISLFFPSYTCLVRGQPGQSTECNSKVLDLTPIITAEIFFILILIGAGIGWFVSRKRVGATMN